MHNLNWNRFVAFVNSLPEICFVCWMAPRNLVACDARAFLMRLIFSLCFEKQFYKRLDYIFVVFVFFFLSSELFPGIIYVFVFFVRLYFTLYLIGTVCYAFAFLFCRVHVCFFISFVVIGIVCWTSCSLACFCCWLFFVRRNCVICFFAFCCVVFIICVFLLIVFSYSAVCHIFFISLNSFL